MQHVLSVHSNFHHQGFSLVRYRDLRACFDSDFPQITSSMRDLALALSPEQKYTEIGCAEGCALGV
jgi:hypothetical protein